MSAHPAGRVDERGNGWIAFSIIMLGIVGTLNIVYGIGAISDAHVYVGETKYVIGDLNLWGWLLLAIGLVQFVAAFGLWSRAQWARWVGVGSASGNMIFQLLFLPALPLLSLSLLALDLLVVYGLVQYGGRD
jgi:hypothetical protein